MHLKQVCIFPQKFPIHDRYPFNLHIGKIYSFGRSSLEQIGYEETEHFQVYKSFMQDPNKYLQDL